VDDFILEGDKMVVRWTMRATNSGPLPGYVTAATGKRIEIWGNEIDRVVDGKIVETWSAYDRLGLMQQLGVLPAPGQAGA